MPKQKSGLLGINEENSTPRHLAILSSDFPPSNLPQALRTRFFANHLAEFGWRTTVITTDPRFYETPVDPEHGNLVDSHVNVIRTRAAPAALTRKIGLGDVGIRSMWQHWRALTKLMRTDKPDVLFLPIPPNIPSVIGFLASLRFGLSYVIDYNDPWVDEFNRKTPVSERPGGRKWLASYLLSRIIEPIALRNVGHVTTVSESYTAPLVARYRQISADMCTGIPYGGEPKDFKYVATHPRVNPVFDPHDGRVHLSYVGRGGVDMKGPIEAVLVGVRDLVDHQPSIRSRLAVHFIGTSYYDGNAGSVGPIAERARELDIADVVTERVARVSYLDSIQILTDSHGLLVIGSELPHYTASKLFPNILSSRPLLGIFNAQSSSVDIIRMVEAGRVVTFAHPEELRQHQEEIESGLLWLTSCDPAIPNPTNWNEFESYTVRSMTERLANVLNGVMKDNER